MVARYATVLDYNPYAPQRSLIRRRIYLRAHVFLMASRLISDWATTGNFEVVLVNTGELLHSKKTRGQGLCEKFEEVGVRL